MQLRKKGKPLKNLAFYLNQSELGDFVIPNSLFYFLKSIPWKTVSLKSGLFHDHSLFLFTHTPDLNTKHFCARQKTGFDHFPFQEFFSQGQEQGQQSA